MDAAVWAMLRPHEEGARARLEEWLEGDGGRAHLRAVEARHGREAARFVSLQRELRARAAARFPDGRIAVATGKGLEQATPAAVADRRARRFASGAEGLDGAVAWDACCGIGSDALALARAGLAVLATDRDPGTARCAAFHLATDPEVGARPAGVAVADAGAHLPPPGRRGRVLGLFDPDRRREGRRVRDPRHWSPPLDRVLDAAAALAGAALKLPPGLAPGPAGLEGADGADGALLEWTSLDGELKELTAWTGRLGRALDDGPARRAVALRSDGAAATFEGEAGAVAPAAAPFAPGRWLVELDASLDLAGLAPAFARAHDLASAEGGAGYLLADAEPRTGPLLAAWPVLDVLPMDRKRLRAALRARGAGKPTIKTRGIREAAEEIAARVDGGGSEPCLVAVTQGARGRVALVLGPPVPGAASPGGLVGDEGLEPPTPSL